MNDTQTDVQEGRLSEVGGKGFGGEGELEEGSSCISEEAKARFWRKVNKTDGCWLWTGAVSRNGYGQFTVGGKTKLAHRVAWLISNGSIPRGEGHHGTCVLHKCDTPLCVRPDHLFLGTAKDNSIDMVQKGRHFSRTSPHRIARGDRNGSRIHPENVRRGISHWRARLSASDIEGIRSLYATGGITQRELAGQFHIAQPHVSRIVCGIRWAHI